MLIKLTIILMLALFIAFMAWWVVKTEEKSNDSTSFVDPDKSYNKAKEYGLKLPSSYNDALPGV